LNNINARLASELRVKEAQINAAVALLDEGATVPFIARYRKEATGGLDDTKLRTLEERLGYLRELEERRAVVLASIRDQQKLTPELETAIQAADTKVRLEDLYRPYMPKRRTKAQVAREAGLEPLALALLHDPTLDPETAAAGYLNPEKGVEDVHAALQGARQILMEMFAEDAELLAELRKYAWEHGRFQSKVLAGKEVQGAKFKDYFDTNEPIKSIPSHRALAMFRGHRSGILQLKLVLDVLDEHGQPVQETSPGEAMILRRFGIQSADRPGDAWLLETGRMAWRGKLSVHLDIEMKRRLHDKADAEAIKVFARNLHDLLLSAPAGPRPTIGLDPGVRTGVKVAVIDETGKLLETATVYPHPPRNERDQALAVLARLAAGHNTELIAVGNGTASRETDALAGDLIKQLPELKLIKIVVSEAGASVYSASELAAKEFPALDVSLRGAVSIARRLQDPLAELVKIDPKSIGVGQYQHDVSQTHLAKSLDNVVEDCVNSVGVDLNTASVFLLARVSGLNASLAENIVSYRDEHGPFRDRQALTQVPRLGPKTFEQAAGFLRIMNGDNPLDASAVHPEAYPVVERILAQTGRGMHAVIGDSDFLRSLNVKEFTDERFGEPTVRDILTELEKPGRDPRPEFRTAAFKEDVHSLADLQPGMALEGVVTNVTNFGAFVDIGVHQDGLVHISKLSTKYISDPHKVVKAGDIVQVTVVDVDLERNRIALSMCPEGPPQKAETQAEAKPEQRARPPKHHKKKPPPQDKPKRQPDEPEKPMGALAEQLAKLKASTQFAKR
jgi:uncharacterized protein